MVMPAEVAEQLLAFVTSTVTTSLLLNDEVV